MDDQERIDDQIPREERSIPLPEPTDLEVEFEMFVVVKVQGYGRERHQRESAQEIARVVNLAFGDRATTYLLAVPIPLKHAEHIEPHEYQGTTGG